MAAYGQNIGMAAKATPNARSAQLTKMVFTMIGTWKGEYSYFDERQGDYVKGSGSLVFSATPMPSFVALAGRSPLTPAQ